MTLLLYMLYVRHKCFTICMYTSSYFGSKLSLQKPKATQSKSMVGATPRIKHRVDDRSTGVTIVEHELLPFRST